MRRQAHLVKLAYEDIHGGREHLWFEVHGLRHDSIDATLKNEPLNIPSMYLGQRAWHRIERLTDWAAFTPHGIARPWFVKPFRTS